MPTETHDELYWRTLQEMGGQFWERLPELSELESGSEFPKMLRTLDASGGTVETVVYDHEEESQVLKRAALAKVEPNPVKEQSK